MDAEKDPPYPSTAPNNATKQQLEQLRAVLVANQNNKFSNWTQFHPKSQQLSPIGQSITQFNLLKIANDPREGEFQQS